MPNEKAVISQSEQQRRPSMIGDADESGNKPDTFVRQIERATHWLAPALISITILFGYLFSPAVPPLLDEQFFLKWTSEAGRHSAPLMSYLMWNGYAAPDLWGPFTGIFNKISHTLLFGLVPLLRIQGMILHALTASLLFFTARRLWKAVNASALVPLAASILYAIYPLNAEAVCWFGGRGLELAGLGLIASLYCYLRARDIGTDRAKLGDESFNWRWLIASFSIYILALLSSSAIWSSCLIFAGIELWARLYAVPPKPTTNSADLTTRIIGPLAFLFVTAAYIAAIGTIWQLTSYDVRPDFSIGAIAKTLRAIFFPINEAIWHKYAYAYDVLYVLFPPFVGLFVASLITNKNIRPLMVLCSAWLFLALFPEMGHIAKQNLFGSRLFYIAAMPLACLLAMIFCSAPYALPKRWQMTTGIISAIAVMFLTGFYFAHLTNQNMAWRNGGRQIAAVQKSLSVVESHTNAPYLLASEIPEWVSVSPKYSTNGMVVFDGKTRLLAAGAVSPGRLKDALSIGHYQNATLNWIEDLRSFMPIDVTGPGDEFKTIDAKEIAARFVPAIVFFKTAHLDEAQDLLLLESNNDRGPAMRIASTGLSAGGKNDFLYIDARIEAPAGQTKPIIEMYWQTGTHPDYDNKMRRVWTKAFLDGNYHRYFLPMRSIGWVASGPLMTLTFGFPAGAKVAIKEMGVEQRDAVSPSFDAIANTTGLPAAGRFTPPYFNFPNEPDLGLFSYGQNVPLTVSHDCSRIAGATGVAIEISMPDKVFPNPNGNEASGVGGKTIGIDGVRGTYEIPTQDFPRTGVYSMRAIAIDSGHNPIGQYSDAVYCLVRTPQKTGWVEQLQ
jgi:hypothetical protein